MLNKLFLTLKAKNYKFQPFADFLRNPVTKFVILRHDVDARKINSLVTARIEKELGITGTYYFRMVPESFDEEVIKEIDVMGHEVGYHYEDVNLAVRRFNAKKGEESIAEIAIESFKENLERLRKIVTVETACMHGSPLSKWDNRLLWKYYDYRDFGITGEPYFDIDFNKVLYLTDTGRRWDGEAVNIRDKVSGVRRQASGKKGNGTRNSEPMTQIPKPLTLNSELKLHSTFDIIEAANNGTLPDKIMITIHPQRWSSQIIPWISELVWQNVKNVGKRVIQARLRD